MGEVGCWRAGSGHTATCGYLLSSIAVNNVPVLTRPERSGSGSACREQPAKGQKDEGRQACERKKIHLGSNSNLVADTSLPRAGIGAAPPSSFGLGLGKPDISLNRLPARCPHTVLRPPLPARLPRAGPGTQPRAPVPSGGRPRPARLECRLLPTFPIVQGQPPASLSWDPAFPKGWWAAKQVPPTPLPLRPA